MLLHIAEHHLHPVVVFHLHIRIEQKIVIRLDLGESLVVALCKPIIAFKNDKRCVGELLFEHGDRSVGGAIVSDDDFHPLVLGVLDDRWEVFPHHLLPVPIENNYGNFHDKTPFKASPLVLNPPSDTCCMVLYKSGLFGTSTLM